jgi:hypothetical protein
MATKTKTTTRKKKQSMPKCNHMAEMHRPELPTIAVLSLISAATHAVQNGYDTDDDYVLEGAINALLVQCHIDCTFKKGKMILTYDADAYRKAKRSK